MCYAVAKGKHTGIFSTWEEAQAQVKGFSNARYRKFQAIPETKTF